MHALIVLFLIAAMVSPAAQDADGASAARELEIFKTWLQKNHAGYGCDEGPARFRNAAVEAAYGGRRFYYVLTYARGIGPPFRNSLSLVASVERSSGVQRLDMASLATFRRGLKKIARAKDARRASAAVLILALGDPGQRRWPIQAESIEVERIRGEWVCTFLHDPNHASRVRFDRSGLLSAIDCRPPPVP